MKNILGRRNSRCVLRSLGTEQHQVFKELTKCRVSRRYNEGYTDNTDVH